MEIFETADEMVNAITNCKDPKEAKNALKVLVGFSMHEKGAMTSGVEQTGLPNKITLSLLMVAVKNMAKKGGE